MVKVIDKRSTGKTGRLLLLAKENNGIVVCHNPIVMKEKSLAYGIVGIDFISYDDYAFQTAEYDHSKPVYIDELELFLQKIDTNIQGFTLSEDA